MKIDVNHLTPIRPLHPGVATKQQLVEKAEEVRDVFRQFVGEAFFSQLLKSMRSTQGKPAYFHGGHAEEVFQSQLDQVLSEKMTEASADQIADPMFRQQFSNQAEILKGEQPPTETNLIDLNALRRI